MDNAMPTHSPDQLLNSSTTRLLDARRPAVIGRTARLELVFERRAGRTVIAHAYAEPPFRIGRSFDVDGAAYVVLVCSGPGVFAGDVLSLSLRVASGARVVLTSQSALQVHPSAAPSPAHIRHRYVVEEEGELHAHWDPVIPFTRARLDQRFDLEVGEDSRLYWSDALMAGRISRGEAWRFESLTHELRLRVGTTLKYLERYTVTPGLQSVVHPWIVGRMNYVATALVHHPRVTADMADSLHRTLEAAAPQEVNAAVDLLEPRLLVGRLLGSCGASFSAARASYQELVLASIFDRPTQLLRK